MRKFLFRDLNTNTEIVLPVTPESFEVSHGIRIETINIHTLGDVNLAGYGTLCSFNIECMFPSQAYSFASNLVYTDPYKYILALEAFCDARKPIRFIVSDTMVNVPVLIEDIAYGEKDGTNDVYATIALKKYRTLSTAASISTETQNNTRSTEAATVTAQNYTVKSGDTLGAICRKFYGDSSLYSKLAKFNSIKNANLIFSGQSVQLPDKNLLA